MPSGAPRALTAAPVLAALLGGVAYAASQPGIGAWPLALVAWVPLWGAVEGGRSGHAFGLGLVFGLAAYAVGAPWLWRLVEVFLEGNVTLGVVLWLANGLWMGFGFAVATWAFGGLRRGGGPAWAAALPFLFVEWGQPQLFASNAGSALIGFPLWAQSAELGGPLLLSAWVLGANAALHAALQRQREGQGGVWRPALGGVALLIALTGYGWARIAEVGTPPGGEAQLRVGIVQANLDVREKRRRSTTAHTKHLEQSRALLASAEVDLLVWPETAYPLALRRPLPLDGQLVRQDLRVPLLFGATSLFEAEGRRVTANSALLIGREGSIQEAYDKNLLIPVAEAVPGAGVVPWPDGLFPHAQRFRAGTETPALRLGETRIAVPLCYEAIRADFVRRMVSAADPQLLVTLANDAWFGDSAEPHFHLGLARLRAIEHRRWLVRATNSGISAIVDPAGRIVARTGVLSRENLVGRVGLREGRSLYGRFGDAPVLAGAVACVLLGLARGPGRAR